MHRTSASRRATASARTGQRSLQRSMTPRRLRVATERSARRHLAGEEEEGLWAAATSACVGRGPRCAVGRRGGGPEGPPPPAAAAAAAVDAEGDDEGDGERAMLLLRPLWGTKGRARSGGEARGGRKTTPDDDGGDDDDDGAAAAATRPGRRRPSTARAAEATMVVATAAAVAGIDGEGARSWW
jgi:hypothetical protein